MAVDGRDEMRPEDARIAALYRHATGEMPPERLDSAIRKHARAPNDGVKPQKHTLWRPAWRLPFVAAALAVVCASVVTLVMERDGGRLTVPPETPAPDGGGPRPSVFSVSRRRSRNRCLIAQPSSRVVAVPRTRLLSPGNALNRPGKRKSERAFRSPRRA